MNCDGIQSNLGAFLDDELAPDLRAEVTAHLADCPRCASELRSLQALAMGLGNASAVDVPAGLWSAIDNRLEEFRLDQATPLRAHRVIHVFRRPLAAAASLLLIVGLSAFGIFSLQNGATRVEAAEIDFSQLLDALPNDARAAFQKFLIRYHAEPIAAHQAHARAPELNFEIPMQLPGGFERRAVYAVRFGGRPGIAAEYRTPGGEFLAALFHPPVRCEDYGTHRDHPCAIGQHRGHTVRVGQWSMVHLTDVTTCHCVLSRLDPEAEVPAIMSAIAPRSIPIDTAAPSRGR